MMLNRFLEREVRLGDVKSLIIIDTPRGNNGVDKLNQISPRGQPRKAFRAGFLHWMLTGV